LSIAKLAQTLMLPLANRNPDAPNSSLNERFVEFKTTLKHAKTERTVRQSISWSFIFCSPGASRLLLRAGNALILPAASG